MDGPRAAPDWSFNLPSNHFLSGIGSGAVSAISQYESGDSSNDRHSRHASRECDGQGEDYGYLLHDRLPFCRCVASNIHRLAWLSFGSLLFVRLLGLYVGTGKADLSLQSAQRPLRWRKPTRRD
jgi:hypothetical protein